MSETKIEDILNIQFEKHNPSFYNIHISDVIYESLFKYPKQGLIYENNTEQKIANLSTKIDKPTTEYLKKEFKENLNPNSIGVIFNSKDNIMVKFIKSIIFSKFTKTEE